MSRASCASYAHFKRFALDMLLVWVCVFCVL